MAVPFAKKLLAPSGLTAAMPVIDAGIQKKNTWFRNNNFNNFKRRNEWHKQNCSSLGGFKYFIERSY